VLQEQSSVAMHLEGQNNRYIDDCTTTTQLVRSLADLQRGDHVTWKRSAGIWHHAIVVSVDAVSGQLEVVHYNGSIIREEGQSSFASIRREWVSVSLRSKDLYRVDYDNRLVKCFSPEVVVERAMSRVDEAEYNPLTHNCEHLARWCKTGQPRSIQVY
jgi:Lecithin retinol acyltransferase